MKHGFQEKTVRRVIRKKIETWLESLPVEMRKEIGEKVICTGGAPASMLLGEEIKDFDFYLKTKEAAATLARHYVSRFLKFHPECNIEPKVRVGHDQVWIYIKSSGVTGEGGDEGYEYYEMQPGDQAATAFLDKAEKKTEQPKDDKPFRPTYLSENAISLSDKVQIVIRFFGECDEIHVNYDFEHCKVAYDYATDSLTCPPKALLSLMSRTLYYTGSKYPLCSLFRMRKFIDRGWHISAGEILKMAFQVSDLDLTDENTLREQLIGVDMAYFSELLRVLEAEKEGRKDKPIDSTYLAILVDRIFNT
jgi:hypothetical protein